MRLILLTVLTMTAFAANSVLNRLGVARFGMDPMLFAVVRVAAGAVVLVALMRLRGRAWPGGGWRRRVGGAGALALYMVGFSTAYLTLDAGIGALILFGIVQLTMFAGAILSREPVGEARVAGACVALAGLAVLVWPGGDVVLAPSGVVAMAAAGVGWGVYSLLGRREADPLAATAANFALCLPPVVPLLALSGGGWSAPGIAVAVVAGAVTSGLGYALWYAVVPHLGAARAAVAQLSVPVIAAAGGVALLGEAVGLRFWIAAALVLGGIALSLRRGQVTSGSSGS